MTHVRLLSPSPGCHDLLLISVFYPRVLILRYQATYSEFYIANVYGQHSVEVIEDHDPGNGPLFLYTAFTAGHDPLQALSEDFEGCDPEVMCGLKASMYRFRIHRSYEQSYNQFIFRRLSTRCLEQSTLSHRHYGLTVVPSPVFDRNKGFSFIGDGFCFPHDITMVLFTVLLNRSSSWRYRCSTT